MRFGHSFILRLKHMTSKILIVEDDPNLLEALKYNLKKESYAVVTAIDGEQALEVARRERPDLILLDIMLPKLSGFEVCRILRQEMTAPIVMLTAKADEIDKILGLEIGADDYVTKPFSVRELIARIRAMLRRSQIVVAPPAEDKVVKIGDLKIDLSRHQVSVREDIIDLKPMEFALLAFLAQNKGLVFTREQLLEKVWGYDYAGDTRTVDVHVRWLRQKIENNPADPKYLITIRGTGYKLEDEIV